MKLHLISTAALLALGTVPGRAVAEEVPGCGCSADLCKSLELDLNKLPDACNFMINFSYDTIPDTTEPICAALQNSSEFQDEFGSSASPYTLISSGTTTVEVGGPRYYSTGALPISVRSGTCSEVIAEQESCEVDPENYVDSGINNQGDLFPRTCSVTRAILPNTNTEVTILPICASLYNDNITSGFEDELHIFVETGDGIDSCIAIAEKNTPVLTSQDWIEPIPGQHYMCYQFLDPNDATKT